MAGADVRCSRESFADGSSECSHVAAVRLPFEWASPTELLLGLFVSLQLAEFALLGATGRLDLPIAACLSASLLTVARIAARQRSLQSGTPVIAERAVPAEQERPVELQVQPATQYSGNGEACTIAEDSQPWAELMARISHEIRTPLNAVIGFSDLMGREIFGPLGNPRYGEYARYIKESGDSLLKSAEDTLALSSLLAEPAAGIRPQVTDLQSLALDAWRFLEPQADRRGIRLEPAIEHPLDISGDRRAYRQVVLNLLAEAVDRAADGSSITITASARSGAVKLVIAAPHCAVRRHEPAPSLAVCVAGALLERLGCRLTASIQDQGWRASTVLDHALQPDFFAQPAREACGRHDGTPKA